MFGKNASSYILKTAFLLVLMEEIIPFLFQGIRSGEDSCNPYLRNLPTQVINSTKLPRFGYTVILGERFGARDDSYFPLLNEELKNPRILKITG